MRMSTVRFFSLACAVSAVSVANADVTFGGNRSFGMGGAGLALPVRVGQNYRLNPAFLAFGSKNPQIQWPGIGYRLSGLGPSDISDLLGDLDRGGLDSDKVIELAQIYSDTNKVVAVNGEIGFRFAGLAIGAKGELGLNTIPNEQLRTWAQNGGDTSNVDAGSRLDAYGYGYQQIEVGYGNTIAGLGGRLSIGVNARKVSAYYAHKFADRDTIQNGNENGVQNGSGIADDFAKADGIGLDFGAIYRPRGNDNLFVGMVVENLVSPKIKFPYEAPGGGQPILANGFDPFKRSVSVGLGFQSGKTLLAAADWVDLGNQAGRSEFRSGLELSMGDGFAFRAGYNTRTAFTYGVRLGSLNIQFAGNAPITLGSVIRF